uniref:Uncharacterized protein n=1 Tax=Anguilla anguilla TaxID=7936 RepID=A0A0E9WG12_ANGAN
MLYLYLSESDSLFTRVGSTCAIDLLDFTI